MLEPEEDPLILSLLAGEHGGVLAGADHDIAGRARADDLRRLCDALGLRKPVVLGSSFGGNVALTYAALFPGHPAASSWPTRPGATRDPWSVLGAVRCPVLILAGEDDSICPLPVVEETSQPAAGGNQPASCAFPVRATPSSATARTSLFLRSRTSSHRSGESQRVRLGSV